MSKNSTMNIFINSGEKILPAQKLSIFTKEKAGLFIGPKGHSHTSQKGEKIKIIKEKKVKNPLFSPIKILTNSDLLK